MPRSKSPKFKWFLEAIFWCTWKGVMAIVFRKPDSKRDWMENLFGWKGEMIDILNRDIWQEQTTLPRGGKSHHRTDLLVEWNRLNPQRGAKLFCAYALFTFIVGFAIGLIF
jgi:hypothetical protein